MYGVIAEDSWVDDGVTPKQFVKDIAALGQIDELNVHIFSNGGDVFAGNAIYGILKQQKATVNIYIEGIAASIATVIAMAGDNVCMSDNAMFMVHNPWRFVFGGYNAAEMRSMANELDRAALTLMQAYRQRTGMSDTEIMELLDGDDGQGTWLTADEAVKYGFADAITPEDKTPEEAAAMIHPGIYSMRGKVIDTSKFKNMPEFSSTKRKKGEHQNMGAKAKVKNVLRHGRLRAEVVEVTCPDCGAVFEIETEITPDEEVLASRRRRSVRAELIEVVCPECGAMFEVELSVEAEELEVIDEPTEPAARVRGRARTKARQTKQRPRNEIYTITCPECGATFEWDTEPPVLNPDAPTEARRRGVVKAELLDVVCPECGASFQWETDAEPSETPSDYEAGVLAERERTVAFNDMKKAFPQCESLINACQKSGSRIEKTNALVLRSVANKNSSTYNALSRDAGAVKNIGRAVHSNGNEAYVAGFASALNKKRGIKNG